jgi:hypothetical protein
MFPTLSPSTTFPTLSPTQSPIGIVRGLCCSDVTPYDYLRHIWLFEADCIVRGISDMNRYKPALLQ